jgi:hypothetical protein
MSYTTLAPSVVARMPAVYQLLPPDGSRVLLDAHGAPVEGELLDHETWKRYGWPPFGPAVDERQSGERAFVKAALARARAFHDALARPPHTPCPTAVTLVGGDCLPTLARAVVSEGPPGTAPRFEPKTPHEQDLMYEAGDGRVTRPSVLAAHLPAAEGAESGCGIPEATRTYFGAADHHGLYADPAFQSLILRLLLAPPALLAGGSRPAPGTPGRPGDEPVPLIHCGPTVAGLESEP